MKKILTPFRVGLLVVASAVFLFIFLTFVRKGGMSSRESLTVFAYFNDASGLGKKSRVQIAGIPVGELGDIALERVADPKTGEERTKAKVTLLIRRDVGLREDAALTKRSESLIGDYMLDLFPGTDRAPLMPNGGEIKRVNDTQGMDAIFSTLDKITLDIQDVTAALRTVLGGDKGASSMQRIVENLVKLSDTVDATVRNSSKQLDAILSNFQEISSEVRKISEGEQGSVERIVLNVDYITRDLRDVLATVKKIVGSGEGDFQESVASLKELLNRLNTSLTNVEEVTNNVKAGHGIVGALVSDDRLGQKVSETVEDVSDFASRLTRLEAEVSVRSEYLVAQGAAKNTIGLRLIPRPDKYYLLEAVDDPRGNTTVQTVQTNPPNSGNPVTQVQRVTSDSLKFSAEFAKRFYFTTLRFGIIESTGGVGLDFSLPVFWRDFLTLKLDAFDFSVDSLHYPRLRATLRLSAFQHLYASAGIDDMLNAQVRDALTHQLTGGRDYFIGGGIYFTDDDLKSILPVAPKP